MGRTVIEKIFSEHLHKIGDPVEPGRIVWITIDIRSARDFGGANVVGHLEKHFTEKPVGNPAKTVFTFDCNAPATTTGYAENQQKCRSFAAKHGIKVYDVDAGIGSHILIEDSYATPGRTIVGTDSHMNILGAVGCFGQGMGDQDIAFVWAKGYTWFEVPESVKITINGEIQFPTTAKDLTLHLTGTLGTTRLLGKAVEFYGPTIERLTLEERITLASMATEMGAITAFIPPNEFTRDFDGFNYDPDDWNVVMADKDAQYAESIVMDVTDLPPLVARPGSPNDVVPVSEITGQHVDTAFIGSCTNGRISDFETALDILGNKRIREGRTLKITPATRRVYGDMLKKSYIEKFFATGALILSPGCGGCAAGQVGMTGSGEVQVSTSNRNFPGKQGRGETYLASPATAAASVLNGEITDPREVLK